MAVVQELIAKLGFRVDQAGLQKADNGLKSMATSAFKMFAAYQLASRSFGLVVESVKQAANLEALNAEFEVLLKNAEAAKYLVQQIQEYAIPSPFPTAVLAASVRLMMSFGQSANDAFDAVKRIGDVAGADTERMQRLSLAYAQTMSAQKLTGQDLLQYVNAGFNPLAEIAKTSGKSMNELRGEMEKGLITSQMVKDALVAVTSEGGMFFGNTAKQAQTLRGLWSNMADGFRLMMADLGGMLVPFIKAVLTAFNPMMDSIAGAYRQLGAFFALMFSDGPEAGDIAAGIAASFMTIADAIMAVAASFKFLLLGVTVFQMGIAQIVGLIVDTIMFIPKAIGKAVWGIIELAKVAASVVPGANKNQWAGASRWLEENTQLGEYVTRATVNGAEAVGKDWNKFMDLSSMIGGSKAPDAGSKVKLTDDILKALQGNSKVVNNNVSTSVTVHAEGTMKDILKEQANSVFGTVLGLQLRAATV